MATYLAFHEVDDVEHWLNSKSPSWLSCTRRRSRTTPSS
jgi:hypothetical protein